MDQPTNEIIRLCQTGEAEAFCEVVGLYEKPMFGYVYRLLWNSPYGRDAEDAVQEIFLKAYTAIGTFRPSADTLFSSWLFRIAHNHCVSLLRKRPSPAAAGSNAGDGWEDIAAAETPGPREAASGREAAERVALAVARLPEDQKSALVLRCYEDMSYEEIAALQECSVGTVKSRVARARDKLAAELHDLAGEWR